MQIYGIFGTKAKASMGEIGLATIIIIAINVIVTYKGFKDRAFFEKYKFNVGDIKRRAKYQIISSGFLRVDPTHLFVNMLTLYFFANVVIFDLNAIGFIV